MDFLQTKTNLHSDSPAPLAAGALELLEGTELLSTPAPQPWQQQGNPTKNQEFGHFATAWMTLPQQHSIQSSVSSRKGVFIPQETG